MFGSHCLDSSGRGCSEETGAAVWAVFSRLLQLAQTRTPDSSSLEADGLNRISVARLVDSLEHNLDSAHRQLDAALARSDQLEARNRLLTTQLQDCESVIKSRLELLERVPGSRSGPWKSDKPFYSPSQAHISSLQRDPQTAWWSELQLRRADPKRDPPTSALLHKYDFKKQPGPSLKPPAASTRDWSHAAQAGNADRRLLAKGLPFRRAADSSGKLSALGSFEASRQKAVRSQKELEDTDYETHFYYDSEQGPLQLQETPAKCGSRCNCSDSHTEHLSQKPLDPGPANASFQDDPGKDPLNQLLRQNRSMQSISMAALTAAPRQLSHKKSSLSLLKADASRDRLPDTQSPLLRAVDRSSIRDTDKPLSNPSAKHKASLSLLTQEIKSIISKREYQPKKYTHSKN